MRCKNPGCYTGATARGTAVSMLPDAGGVECKKSTRLILLGTTILAAHCFGREHCCKIWLMLRMCAPSLESPIFPKPEHKCAIRCAMQARSMEIRNDKEVKKSNNLLLYIV